MKIMLYFRKEDIFFLALLHFFFSKHSNKEDPVNVLSVMIPRSQQIENIQKPYLACVCLLVSLFCDHWFFSSSSLSLACKKKKKLNKIAIYIFLSFLAKIFNLSSYTTQMWHRAFLVELDDWFYGKSTLARLFKAQVRLSHFCYLLGFFFFKQLL